MNALILKDLYVIWKQMRIFILVILFMAAVNTTFNSVFLVVWSSMLPYTAMAYDERSHWDQMAAMMPYSRRDIVLSKYILGWLCMAVSSLLCLVMQTIIGAFSSRVTDFSTLLISLGLGVIALDLTLPMVFRFGVERGRMIFMIIIFGAAISAGLVIESAGQFPALSLPVLTGLLAAAAVVCTAVSVSLSMKLYKAD